MTPIRSFRSGALVAALALLLAGCPSDDDDDAADDDTGDDDTADDDTGDDDTADDDTGDDDTTAGCGFSDPEAARLEVGETYIDGGGWSARVGGTVFDGPWPTYHVAQIEQGACRYLEFVQGFCDPPCDNFQFCNHLDECEDYPSGLSGGTLTFTGLGDDIVIPPDEWNVGYYWGPWDLPGDIFDEGDPIGASLTGADFPAVTLEAEGVAAMDTDIADALWPMVDGQDAEITWTPGTDPEACVRVLINGANNSHGMPLNHVIWCETEDTGAVTIPQALVEAFPLGSWPEICVGHDCPPSELVRYRRDAATVPQGIVELEVVSRIYFGYDHTE